MTTMFFQNTSFKLTLGAMFITALAACGGGSDTASGTCQPFSDSFGKAVTCEEMRQLAGTELGFVDGGDASSGAGDAGADGTGADGAAIANAELEFTDINGKKVNTKTDPNGYYRINLRGMKAPLVATVKRDGRPWKSMLVQDIVRAPANRQFYTINLTGLTDVVASDVAKKAGLSGADALTPTALNAQKAAVPAAIESLNKTIATQLTAAGLDPTKFDPLKNPFLPNQTGYDKVLESVTINRTSNGSTTIIPTIRSAVCNVPNFSGASQPQGASANMTVASDGGYCTVALMADSARTIPAYNGQIQSAPTSGFVVFSDNRVYYTPNKGYAGSDSFVYTMDGVVNGIPVKLRVNMSVTVQSPPVTPSATGGNILSLGALSGTWLENYCDARSNGVGTSSKFSGTFNTDSSGVVSFNSTERRFNNETCSGNFTPVTEITGTITQSGSKVTTSGLTAQKVLIKASLGAASITMPQLIYVDSNNVLYWGYRDGTLDTEGYPNSLEPNGASRIQ